MKDSDMNDKDDVRESTAMELAEENPIDMERETFSLNMCCAEANVKRGFAKRPYDGADWADVQYESTMASDGGFLGRPHGWER